MQAPLTEPETTRIVAGERGGFPELLQSLKATPGDAATIIISPESGLLLTASEFRSLKMTAEGVGVTVTIESNDRLRQQLAQMFNVEWRPLPEVEQPVREHPSWPERPLDGSPKPRTVTVSRTEIDLPTSKPWKAGVIDVSRETALPPPPSMKPEIIEEDEASEKPKIGRRRAIPARRLATVGAMVVGLLLFGLLGSIFLRTATVAVTLQRQQVTSAVTFGVQAEGYTPPADAAFVVEAVPVTLDASFTQSNPTTGTMVRQTTPATGAVQLRSIRSEAVTIPQGTILTARDGLTYQTTQEVTVEAGSAEQPASAEVGIESLSGGGEANREQGTLFAPVEGFEGVYFGNLNGPIQGGEGEEVAAVSAEDEQQLVATAQEGLMTQASSAPLPDGRVVIRSSLEPTGDLAYTLSTPVGEPADQVSIQATRSYTGLAIDPSQVRAQADAALRSSLGESLPQGYELLPETVQIGLPEEPADAEPGRMQVSATADARAVLDETEQDQLKRELSGASPDEAEQRALENSDVAAAEVEVTPGWLVSDLPVAGRIEIETR